MTKNLEFHTFNHNDEHYLVDVNSMHCFEIDSDAFQSLNGGSYASVLNSPTKTSITKELRRLIDRNVIGYPPLPVGQAVNGRRPASLTLDVSHKCNLACRYCFSEDVVGAGGTLMTSDLAKSAIDFSFSRLQAGDKCGIIFFGGEPLINFNVMKAAAKYAIAAAKEKHIGLSFSITTNGTLLTDDVVRFLSDYRFSVLVSLDGPQEIQNLTRPLLSGQGSFDKATTGLKRLLASGGANVAIRATITHANPYVSQLVDFFRPFNVTCHFAPVSNPADPKLALTEADHEILISEYELLLERLLRFDKEDFPVWEFFSLINIIDQRTQRTRGCALDRGLTVDPQGNVYPCHRFVGFDDFRLGNVVDGLDKSKLADVLGATVETRDGCSTCWCKYICGGGCLFEAYIEGSIYRPPAAELCAMRRRLIEMAVCLYNACVNNYPGYLAAMRATAPSNDCLAAT